MRLRAFSRAIFVAVLLCAFAASTISGQAQDTSSALPVLHVENGPNSKAAQKAHYVVLVSLDGFRWDYAKRDGATHLLALGKQVCGLRMG